MCTADGRPQIAAAVIVDAGRVLLIHRRIPEGDLSWQFPAGKVENDESAGHAAVRETREETGLEVAESVRLGERVHPGTGRTMVYVACTVVSGTARVAAADELTDIAWITHSKLGDYLAHPLHPPVQEHLDSALRQTDD